MKGVRAFVINITILWRTQLHEIIMRTVLITIVKLASNSSIIVSSRKHEDKSSAASVIADCLFRATQVFYE